MNLSTNFTLEEMTFSQTALRLGIDNTPPPAAVDSMRRLCTDTLEAIRTLLGVPLHIDSGFRSAALNVAVKGSATSEHCLGLAADVIPIGMDLHEAFHLIRDSEIEFDQLILECNAWIHVGIRFPGQENRNEVLIASGAPGAWHYTETPRHGA